MKDLDDLLVKPIKINDSQSSLLMANIPFKCYAKKLISLLINK